MELDLVLHPSQAARLARLRLPGVLRHGRSRTVTQRAVWHDSADRELAANGLALMECAGRWHLKRHLPNGASWLPGAPAPLIEQAASQHEIRAKLPSPLGLVGAFEGTRTTLPLLARDRPLLLTIWRGTLRTVAEEREVSRLRLAGDPVDVRRAALALASTHRAAIPRASLDTEVLAMANTSVIPARHTGPPVLRSHDEGGDDSYLTTAEAFRQALGHLTDVLLHYGPEAAAATNDTGPVHVMRVAVRRARSVISVFRAALDNPALVTAGNGLKRLGAALGPTRDWDVFVTETIPEVTASCPHNPALIRLLEAAQRERALSHERLRAWLDGPDFFTLGVELACLARDEAHTRQDRVHSEPRVHDERQGDDALGDDTLGDDALNVRPSIDQPGSKAAGDETRSPQPEQAAQLFAGQALRRRWKRLLAAGKTIEEQDSAALHALRLRAKRARYAGEIFAPLFPGRHATRFLRRLNVLQQRLGVLNDADVAALLTDRLGGPDGPHGYAIGLLLGFAAAKSVTIRPRALKAWNKCRRQTPFWT